MQAVFLAELQISILFFSSLERGNARDSVTVVFFFFLFSPLRRILDGNSHCFHIADLLAVA